jgi:hypothetical protein
MSSLPGQQIPNDNPRGGSLLDPKKWYVEKASTTADREQKCKAKQKDIHQHIKEHMELEKDLIDLARRERIEGDMKEYKDMCEIIVTAIKLDGKEGTCTYAHFTMMLLHLEEPFKTEIDGPTVTVTESNATVMMKDAALEAIKRKILVNNKKNNKNEPSKKKHTNTAACDTVFGADGFTAHSSTTGRDTRLTKQARK